MTLAFGLGAVVGLILALTGAGGAILAVPLLMFFFGWDVVHAAPVALLAVGSAAAVGAWQGFRAGMTRYRAALFMAAVGSLCTPLGTWAAHRLPHQPLALIFAAVLLFVALKIHLQARRELHSQYTGPAVQSQSVCKLNTDTGRLDWTAPCTRALALAGAITGTLSGLLGVGGGFVIIPALRRSSDLPMQAIVATSLLVVALVSTTAVATAMLAGHLDMGVGLPFALGAIAAMLVVRPMAGKLSGPRTQQAFAALAGTVALGMVAKQLL